MISLATLSTSFPVFPAFTAARPANCASRNYVVDFFLFVICLTKNYGSCHVGAVAFVFAAEIHCYKISGFQFLFARNRMRHGRIQSGSDDRVKSKIFCSCFFHLVFQLCCHFQFTDSRPQKIQNLGKCNIADMFCLCQIFDLFCCLDSAQRVYFPPIGTQSLTGMAFAILSNWQQSRDWSSYPIASVPSSFARHSAKICSLVCPRCS